jgi:tRNA(fMet)-specific endonuclease VapC
MSNPIFLLDTNIVSFLMRRPSKPLRNHMRKVPASALAVSVITEAELRFGVAKSSNPKRHQDIVNAFLVGVSVFGWSSDAAMTYGELRYDLQKAGRSLGTMDLLIAAQAKAVGATLVTNDAALLRLAPLVKVVDWTAQAD